ncbi:MAG: LysM peptidoglycan-binding domain-containing protein [Pseudomonadota bacterium]
MKENAGISHSPDLERGEYGDVMIPVLAKFIVWGTATATAGLTAAVATGVLPLEDVRGWFTGKPQVAVVEQKPAPLVAVKPAEKEPVIETVETEPKPILPSFDILRVEENGSVLVAGRAPAGATVELVDASGKIVGTTRASDAGEFVILPDSDLAPGDHSFTLRATRAGEAPIVSAQAGVVRIPERNADKQDGVLAMVVEGGLPSRIVAKPFEDEIEVASVQSLPDIVSDAVLEPVVTNTTAQNLEQAKPEPEATPKSVKTELAALPEPVDAPKTEPVEVAKSELPPVIAENRSSVAVEAVEVENETVFVAGAVKRGKSVRVYINNEAIGTARGTSDDRFLVKKDFPLEPGSHSVRADVLDPASGQVTGRAEVPLVHEPIDASPAETEKVAVVEGEEPALQEQSVALTPNYQVPIRTGSAIIIKPGDNLWRISRKNYGRGIRYTTIYEANRKQIRDPNRIYIGQIFKLPHRAKQ